MQRENVKATFDNMAASYDAQWANLGAINDSLHLLMGGVLSSLPADANLLCVGAGTGAEIIYLAQRFPTWHFTAVEPSTGMLDVCRKRLRALNLDTRCSFHSGYLETLPSSHLFNAATSLLVSQFILEEESRLNFFKSIANYLNPGGILVSSDLSADLSSSSYQSLLQTWLEMMKEGGISSESLDGMRNAYGKSVAVIPEHAVARLIQGAGFEEPNHFYQVGLIHAWYCCKSSGNA